MNAGKLDVCAGNARFSVIATKRLVSAALTRGLRVTRAKRFWQHPGCNATWNHAARASSLSCWMPVGVSQFRTAEQVNLTQPHYALVAECLPANGGQLLCSLAVLPAAMLALKPRIAVRGLTAKGP